MKVLLLNTSESIGGAAIAANRLMHALRKSGVDAKMLVRDKQSDDPNVISINNSWFQRKRSFLRFAWERLILWLALGCKKEYLFALSLGNTGSDISKLDVVKNADIIHLHWINHGFLSIKDIEKLTQLGKPIFWTMHDQWAYSGVCHYEGDYNNYISAGITSFFLKANSISILSKWAKKRKERLYKRATSQLSFICCSQWLANLSRSSSLLKKMDITTIPNPIDTSVFQPGKKNDCRKKLKLPLDKKLILFGALNATDKRKGIDYLLKAIQHLETSNLELVVFGQVKSKIKESIPIPIHSMGYVGNAQDLVDLYNAVDLYVTPSLEDNLPNTIMEAMACGTPCVGFKTGGIPEMIIHKENGYLAEYKNSKDLAEGMNWAIHLANHTLLSENAVKKVREQYAEDIIAKKVIKLYKSKNII